jgi:hypothetical protein
MAATNSSPNAGNYYSGTGIIKIWLDGESAWRDIGNCPMFTITAAVEEFEHKSNRVASRFVDFSHITSRSAGLNIGMEEHSADNMALACFGTEIPALALVTTATVAGTAVTAIASTTGLVVGETYAVAGTNFGTNNYMTYNGGSAGTLKTAGISGTAVAASFSKPLQIDGMVASEKRGKLRFFSTNDIGPRVQFDFPSVSFSPIETLTLLQEELGNMEISAKLQGDANGRFWRELWNITAEFDD